VGNDTTIRSARRPGRRTRPGRWAPRQQFKLSVFLVDRWYDCWYTPRRGYHCFQTRLDSVPTRLIAEYPAPEWIMKKKTVGQRADGASAATHLAPIESDFWSRLPNLLSHVAVTRYDDGTSRMPGSIIIKTVGSSWVLVLKDPDGACQMQCLGNTLDDALILADLLLGSEEAPWEVDQWARKAQSKNKK